MSERLEGPKVHRNTVILKVTSDDLILPFPDVWYAVMQAATELKLELP